MACKGSYCGKHCTKHITSQWCIEKYRAPETGNYDFPEMGDHLTAEFTNHLKIALNQEIDTRNTKRNYGATSVEFTDVVPETDFIAKTNTEVLVELKDKLNSIITNTKYSAPVGTTTEHTTAGNYPTDDTTSGDALSSTTILNDTYAVNSKCTEAHWKNIRDKILSLMRECLCNGDCGVNYWCGCYNNCGCNYSDERLKVLDTKEAVSSLEEFNQIKSKKWKYTFDNEHEFFGPIAQEVEKVYPEVLREDGQGYKMLNQMSMIGILWGALNKSIDKIGDLERRIEELEQK